jgi:hypothetical protein
MQVITGSFEAFTDYFEVEDFVVEDQNFFGHYASCAFGLKNERCPTFLIVPFFNCAMMCAHYLVADRQVQTGAPCTIADFSALAH